MKITIKNLGILESAEYELGNLTVVCGKNNTGKTYAAYALYGFLDYWRNDYKFQVDPTLDKEIQNHAEV
ncbi:MAG: ATP-binding protein, partial [Planctomycetaceae bacterium]|nr:ATP-binding protein [Planctomycetaceae bacterium]